LDKLESMPAGERLLYEDYEVLRQAEERHERRQSAAGTALGL
jgi:hypothetical protein